MNIIYALLLGVLQGLTGFLPVSSSGVTIAACSFLGFDAVPQLFFSVLLHMGTVVIILFAMRRAVLRLFIDFGGIVKDLFINFTTYFGNAGKENPREYRRVLCTSERRMCAMVIAASIPTFAVGFLMQKAGAYAVRSLLATGLGFLITAIIVSVMGMTSHARVRVNEVPVKRMLLLGVAQGFTVLPGLSRNALCYAGAELAGLKKKTALQLTLLLMIPACIGALVFEILHLNGSFEVNATSVVSIICGIAAAFLTGGLVFKGALKLLGGKTARVFTLVNVAAAIIAIAAHFVI